MISNIEIENIELYKMNYESNQILIRGVWYTENYQDISIVMVNIIFDHFYACL